MANISFSIYKKEIENSSSKVYFSETEKYDTKRFSDGVQTLSVSVSAWEIKNEKSKISSSEYSIWETAVLDYIISHNDNISQKSSSNTIEYKINDIDERGGCSYEKLLNGVVVEDGIKWLKDIDGEIEKEKWKQAVALYKKNNNIVTATEILNNNINEIKESISTLDENLPSLFNLEPPLIETAIPKAISDPCDFLSELMKAIDINISRINGIPNPSELAQYYIKLGKDNIISSTTLKYDSEKDLIESCCEPVIDDQSFWEDYFKDLDAASEEIRKTKSNDFYIFETVIEKQYNANKIVMDYTYDGINENEYSPDKYGSMKYKEELNLKTGEVSYKEFNYNIIATGGALRASRPNKNIPYNIQQNILEGLKNCWIPLRKGWEEYCNEQGWDSTCRITSGYRPESTSSAHGYGFAIDFQPAYSNATLRYERCNELCSFAYNFFKNHSDINVDQVIREYTKGTKNSLWLHVGYKRPNGQQRKLYYTNMYYDSNRQKTINDGKTLSMA